MIAQALGGQTNAGEVDTFYRYGTPTKTVEVISAAVHEKVAEFLKAGKVSFD